MWWQPIPTCMFDNHTKLLSRMLGPLSECYVGKINMQIQSCCNNIKNCPFCFITCTKYKSLSYKIIQYTPLGVMRMWFLHDTPPFGKYYVANIWYCWSHPMICRHHQKKLAIFLARMPSTWKFALRALFHVPKKSTKTIDWHKMDYI